MWNGCITIPDKTDMNDWLCATGCPVHVDRFCAGHSDIKKRTDAMSALTQQIRMFDK
jgi:hypothetical protein